MFPPPQRSCTGHHRGRVHGRRATMLGLFSNMYTYKYLHGIIIHPTCRYVSVRCQTQNKTVRHVHICMYSRVIRQRGRRGTTCTGAQVRRTQSAWWRFFFLYEKYTFICLSIDGLLPTSGRKQHADLGGGGVRSTGESKSRSTFQSCYGTFGKSPLYRGNNVRAHDSVRMRFIGKRRSSDEQNSSTLQQYTTTPSTSGAV